MSFHILTRMAESDQALLELDGHEVRFSNPDKVFFPARGHTKLDLCEYYLAVADPLLAHMRDRPTSMKRFPSGADGDFFFQKRVPKGAPDWVQELTVSFPSGRSANYLTLQDRAHIAWGLNLGVIDWNPWPVRRPDADHPDELRVDLDPTPGSSDWGDVRRVALCVREVLEEHGLSGYLSCLGSLRMRVRGGWSPVDEWRRCSL